MPAWFTAISVAAKTIIVQDIPYATSKTFCLIMLFLGVEYAPYGISTAGYFR